LERIIAEREGGQGGQSTKRMWAGEESEARRKIRDRTGWSWSSGAEDLRSREPRGPVLDFSREIKMPSVEMKAGAPVLGGVGAKMMAKMGWKEGEGLGKDRAGIIEPIQIQKKTDKRGVDFTNAHNERIHSMADPKKAAKSGILSQKEAKIISETAKTTDIPGISTLPGDRSRSEPSMIFYCNYCSMRLTTEHVLKEHCLGRSHLKKAPTSSAPSSLGSASEVKNPVSQLVELCHRNRWGQPRYIDLMAGCKGKAPPGGFKFEVQVNGVIYGPPDVGTEEKKKAKAECAKYALRSLGQHP